MEIIWKTLWRFSLHFKLEILTYIGTLSFLNYSKLLPWEFCLSYFKSTKLITMYLAVFWIMLVFEQRNQNIEANSSEILLCIYYSWRFFLSFPQQGHNQKDALSFYELSENRDNNNISHCKSDFVKKSMTFHFANVWKREFIKFINNITHCYDPSIDQIQTTTLFKK